MNMQRTAGVWFAGFWAWLVAGLLRLRLRDLPHAELALLLSAVFLAAGMFYRQQRR